MVIKQPTCFRVFSKLKLEFFENQTLFLLTTIKIINSVCFAKIILQRSLNKPKAHFYIVVNIYPILHKNKLSESLTSNLKESKLIYNVIQ